MLLGRRRALLALAALLAVAVIGLRGTSAVMPPPRDQATTGDLRLHQYTIEKLGAADSYYSVVGDELRKHRYPSASLFNWRTPLHYELVSALSIERAARVLAALAMLVVITGTLSYAAQSVPRGAVAFVALFGAMLPSMLLQPRTVLFPEAWTGIFIGLSLNAYVARQFVLAAALGVGAVFFRELGAPYAVVCALLALLGRRWREFAIWAIGGLAYAIYFGVHALAVSSAIQPGDLAHAQSWMRLLGLPFVNQTLYLYGWLTILPAILTPVAAAIGLASLYSTSAPLQLRVSLLAYVVIFCIVGQPFNFYWGYTTMALWGHAFAHSGEGLYSLLRCAIPAVATPLRSGRSEPALARSAAEHRTEQSPDRQAAAAP